MGSRSSPDRLDDFRTIALIHKCFCSLRLILLTGHDLRGALELIRYDGLKFVLRSHHGGALRPISMEGDCIELALGGADAAADALVLVQEPLEFLLSRLVDLAKPAHLGKGVGRALLHGKPYLRHLLGDESTANCLVHGIR